MRDFHKKKKNILKLRNEGPKHFILMTESFLLLFLFFQIWSITRYYRMFGYSVISQNVFFHDICMSSYSIISRNIGLLVIPWNEGLLAYVAFGPFIIFLVLKENFLLLLLMDIFLDQFQEVLNIWQLHKTSEFGHSGTSIIPYQGPHHMLHFGKL